MTTHGTKDILTTLAGTGPAEIATRPVIMGMNGMVTSGHYLASRIGLHVLEEGGNAVDAGVAMGFALAVLEPHLYGIGGEVPILIYLADQRRVVSLSGQGPAPQKANIEWFKKMGINAIPGDGLLAATVPDAVSTWITALSHFGTMRLSQVLEYTIELAEHGFPMYALLQGAIKNNAERFQTEWPTSMQVYMPDGQIPKVGDRFVQTDLANTLKRLVEAEYRKIRSGRYEAIRAARDFFYKGEIAEQIVKFAQENEFLDASGSRHCSLLSKEDLLNYSTRIEEPVTTNYRGYDVYKCGPWSQGPVFLQQINLLEGYNLATLRHNSPEYIHILVEVAKLAFADRERYYGDPDFIQVPLNILLSKEYAAERRKLIDPDHASMELRPGNAPSSKPEAKKRNPEVYIGDTTHLDSIDRWGNMFAATPSGGWFSTSPVIKGLGFPLGSRMQVFYLDPTHPNVLQPGKRPRTTLSPSLILKDGKPLMAFGTPGGDQQDQWTLQFFLNCIDFNMDMQEAVDVPTFHSSHFPSSFYMHGTQPCVIVMENRIPESTRNTLTKKGHKVQVTGPWSNGRVVAIRLDEKTGVITGVSSPRMETGYAMGW